MRLNTWLQSVIALHGAAFQRPLQTLPIVKVFNSSNAQKVVHWGRTLFPKLGFQSLTSLDVQLTPTG
ncbi:hypothetical protein HY26_17635 [Hyphomonas sp. GM-8P]|nr:hypothetical protein HY26_17635 [Hyphomonas sp. GM-8P]